VLTTRDVFRDEFTNDLTYQDFSLQFTNAAGHALEFRTYWWDAAYVKQDKVSVIEGLAPYWDDRMASFPGIWKDGNTWYLVYEGAAENNAFSPGDIGLATSTDGTNFVKHPNNPILRHNTSGWEHANIGTPSLYKENGTWYLFYHGFNEVFLRIGVASGPSLTNLTKAAANPILTLTSGTTAWDTGTVGKRSVIVKEGAYYYFAFEGSTVKPFDQAKWSSGFARTMSLTNVWTKFPGNPVVPQTTSGFGFDGPELMQISNVWYLYVRTTDTTAPTKRFRLAATAPVVIAAPSNILVTAGGNATFRVTVQGTPPFYYQWKFGGGTIPGATDSSYTRTNAQPGDAGNYSVAITNVAGSTTSSLAFLVVRIPPSITAQPQSQTVMPGTNVTFSAAASGTPPLLYQWQRNGTNISGATTNVFNLTNVFLTDEGNYIMTVTNSAGRAGTDSATLTVLRPPPAHFDSANLLPDGTLRLVATGGVNFTYTVEASTNLADWVALTNIFNQTGTFEFIDGDAPNHGYRFYRAR
jgi:hypothetical protein